MDLASMIVFWRWTTELEHRFTLVNTKITSRRVMDSGKRTFGSARGSRRLLVMALALSLALPLTSMVSSLPSAYARTPGNLSGTGTFYDTYVSVVSIQMVGANQVIKDQGLGKVTGVLTGTYGFAATITIAPDGAATYVAIDACKCTVGGKTGGLVFSE